MKIGVCGIGRAGSSLVNKILNDKEHELSFVINRDDSDSIGKDVGELVKKGDIGMCVRKLSDVKVLIDEYSPDVIIDFSNCYTTIHLLELIKNTTTGVVVCTTNFEDHGLMNQFAALTENFKGGIVYAPNLTLGINLLIRYVAKISKMLPDFNFEIVERHRLDKSKPSTTAKIIAKAIDRDGTEIHSVRAGGYVGVHEVTAASECERLTIVHESFSRDAFAYGALLAAKFVYGKTGYFEMKDVINDLEERTL